MSDHEVLSPDNSGSDWDNVLLAQKINKWEVCKFILSLFACNVLAIFLRVIMLLTIMQGFSI